MNENNKRKLEKQALTLIQSGVSSGEIEKQLKQKFIFWKDINGKYTRATKWK